MKLFATMRLRIKKAQVVVEVACRKLNLLTTAVVVVPVPEFASVDVMLSEVSEVGLTQSEHLLVLAL